MYSDNYVILDLDGEKPVVREPRPEILFYNSLTGGSSDHSVIMIFPCTLKNAVLSVSKNLNKSIRRALRS